MSDSMTIGELAKQAGVSVQTLRYYEREGLLEKAPRDSSGYRAYEDDALLRLDFIRRAQELGFTLAEIRDLIALQAKPSSDCGEVCAAAEAKLADLGRMRAELARLIDSCDGSVPIAECAIMECLTARAS